MFEDSFKNLVTAKSLGMSTVFVQSETAHEEGVAESHLKTVDAVVDEVRTKEDCNRPLNCCGLVRSCEQGGWKGI